MVDVDEYEHKNTIIYVKNAGLDYVNGVYKFERIDFNENFSPVFVNVNNKKINFEFDRGYNEWRIATRENVYSRLYEKEVDRNSNSGHELPSSTGMWKCIAENSEPSPELQIVTKFVSYNGIAIVKRSQAGYCFQVHLHFCKITIG